MKDIQTQLEKLRVGHVEQNEYLHKHTTIKIGGPASIFIEPTSVQGLINAITVIKEHKLPLRVIGRGSNLLFPDSGVNGAVIKLGSGLDHLEEYENKVVVGSGFPMIKLATVLSRKGMGGLAFAGGIPGSVGGAVYMNAGAHGSDISRILTRAHILFADGTLEWISNDQMKFSYRTSVLQNEKPGVCIEAEFELKPGNKEEIVAEMQKNKDYRRETQPWTYPCAGSIFRNPLPYYAGKLIEDSGLKGYQIGGAKISEMHANFIVNAGDATYMDVIQLIQYIKEIIRNKYEIEMHTEIEIIPE